MLPAGAAEPEGALVLRHLAEEFGAVGALRALDGHGGSSARVGKRGTDEITNDEPRPITQPEQRRPVCGLIGCDGREVHSHQPDIGFPGQPQPRSAPPASWIDERLSW